MHQALEEVEKNIATMRQVLSGDGDAEPNPEQVSKLALDICKEDVLSLLVQNLPTLGWKVSFLLNDYRVCRCRKRQLNESLAGRLERT